MTPALRAPRRRTLPPGLRRRLRLAAGSFLAAVVVCEGLLRLAAALPATRSWYRELLLAPDEALFLDRMDAGTSYMRLHRVHPTRGWWPLPSLRVGRAGERISTNAAGWRSLEPPVPRPEAFRVMLLGDSFTFGDEADDAWAWPNLLAREEPRWQVMNLGVGGFGLDQMVITAEESFGELRPHLVVLALINDDLWRVARGFFDYHKPRFVLEGEGLRRVGVPVPDLATTVARLKSRLDAPLRLASLLDRRLEQWREPDPGEVWPEVSRRLLARLQGLCARQGAGLLPVYLAWGREIAPGASPEPGPELPVIAAWARAAGLPLLDTGPRFRAAQGPFSDSHYHEHGSRLVAGWVAEAIRAHPAWERWQAEARATPAPPPTEP